jgi:multidrug transporter EmrE-like cation transporter
MINKNKYSILNKHWKPIIFVIICTLLTSSGQILWKTAARNIGDISSILMNIPLWAGFVCYGLGSILLIIALKYGELSVVYPFIALSFVWVTLASIKIFSEPVSLANWLGIVSIIIGVSLIGYGSTK